jgi:heme/copper-type cytochrome/quinol oxidase subunit 2
VSTVVVVAIVVCVFFLIGIVVGVLAVMAMSMFRPERRNRHAPRRSNAGESPPTG